MKKNIKYLIFYYSGFPALFRGNIYSTIDLTGASELTRPLKIRIHFF